MVAYFFFPFALPFAAVLDVVEPTLPALDVTADVALLPAPDLTTSSCLFYTTPCQQSVEKPYKGSLVVIP